MKQIYDFEQNTPPVINENMIRAEIERRRLRWETALVAVGSLLTMCCLLLMAVQLYDIMPLLSFAYTMYVCVAVTGGSVIALVFVQKRRLLIK